MYNIIQYLVTYSVLVPILIGSTKKLGKHKELFSIYWLLLISFLVEIPNTILLFYNVNTMLIFHVFTVIEFLSLYVFYQRFYNTTNSGRYLWVFLMVFLLIAFADLFFIAGYRHVNNIASSTESIFLIIFSLYTFYLIMSKMLYDDLLDTSVFWINSAVLFYFAGTLFLFLFSNYLIAKGNKVYGELYKIHTVFNALWYLLISIGFWKVKKA